MSRSQLKRLMVTATSLFALVTVATVVSAQATAHVPARPTPPPAKPTVFPKITTDTLPNGIRLAVIENHTFPIVAVRVGFAGGFFLDPVGKEGGWSLMVTSLREGTTTRSPAEIADAAADFGTPIAWSPGFMQPSFTTVRAAWKPSLELLADVVMHPAFPVDAVRRLQASQAALAARPPQQSAAITVLTASLYGANHPYAPSFIGTGPSNLALSRDDIVALYSRYLRPQNTVVVVAGDVTPAEARAVVERTFAAWERGGSTIEPTVAVPPPRVEPTTIYLHDDPGATTSHMVAGAVVPSRAVSDATTLEAVNTVFGARMYRAFRTEKGLSYAPAGAIVWHADPQVGHWIASAQVPVAKTDTSVTELLRVMRELRDERPLMATDLDYARHVLVSAIPGQMATVDAVANTALSMMVNRLPTTFYGDYVERLDALSVDQFRATLAKYLDPDHLVIAVVGDRAKIEGPLRATGIPVVIVDP